MAGLGPVVARNIAAMAKSVAKLGSSARLVADMWLVARRKSSTVLVEDIVGIGIVRVDLDCIQVPLWRGDRKP